MHLSQRMYTKMKVSKLIVWLHDLCYTIILGPNSRILRPKLPLSRKLQQDEAVSLPKRRAKHSFRSESDSVVDNMNLNRSYKLKELLNYFKNKGVKVQSINKIDEEGSWYVTEVNLGVI